MALTYAIKKKAVAGNEKRNVVDVTVGVAGDYVNGITLDPVKCGVGRVDFVEVIGQSNFVPWFQDPTNGKLRAVKGNGAAVLVEAVGADVAGSTIRVEVTETVNGS